MPTSQQQPDGTWVTATPLPFQPLWRDILEIWFLKQRARLAWIWRIRLIDRTTAFKWKMDLATYPKKVGLKVLKLEQRKYPVCPECGEHSIVLFAPPKKGMFCDGDWDKVDMQKAHLYCCNAQKNCSFDTKVKDLTTPLTEKM